MRKFPCPDCRHKNDIDSENCEACGISFFVDGEDIPPTSLRAAAMSTEENKTIVRNRYDTHHPERLAKGEAMVTDDFRGYRLGPTAVNRQDFQQVGAMFVAAFEEGADRLLWWEQEPQISVPPWTKVGQFLVALAKAYANTPQGPPGS